MLQLLNIGLNMEGDNGRVQVLDDINLTLEKKKIYVMTGPNGGGKSSIAKVIMGIYDSIGYTVYYNLTGDAQFVSGEIRVLGIPLIIWE